MALDHALGQLQGKKGWFQLGEQLHLEKEGWSLLAELLRQGCCQLSGLCQKSHCQLAGLLPTCQDCLGIVHIPHQVE